jgi:hypothetical protein
MSKGIAWTPEEDQFVRDNYKHHTDQRIAEQIGRSASAVCMRRNKLKMHSDRHQNRGTSRKYQPSSIPADVYRRKLFMSMIRAIPIKHEKSIIDLEKLSMAFAAVENLMEARM